MLFCNNRTESEGLETTEGIDVDCTGVGSSKQCDICHFYFFFYFKAVPIDLPAIFSYEESARLSKSIDLNEKLGYL